MQYATDIKFAPAIGTNGKPLECPDLEHWCKGVRLMFHWLAKDQDELRGIVRGWTQADPENADHAVPDA
jgi:hypothetical protein